MSDSKTHPKTFRKEWAWVPYSVLTLVFAKRNALKYYRPNNWRRWKTPKYRIDFKYNFDSADTRETRKIERETGREKEREIDWNTERLRDLRIGEIKYRQNVGVKNENG